MYVCVGARACVRVYVRACVHACYRDALNNKLAAKIVISMPLLQQVVCKQ